MNYKALSKEELAAIFAGVSFKTPPRLNQLVSLAWAAGEGLDRVSLWHDIGSGKTLIALYLNQLWEAKRILVVCPTSVVATWEQEVAKHTNWQSETVIYQDTVSGRHAALTTQADVCVISYPWLWFVFGRKDATGRAYEVDLQAIKDANFDSVIFDEAHTLRHHEALPTQIAHDLSMHAQNAIIMTGTPVSRGEEDLWSEYWVLDGGKTLGASYRTFVNVHFYKGKFKPYVSSGGRKRILEKLLGNTLRYSRAECLDLPPKTYETRWVFPSDEQKHLTDIVVSGMMAELAAGTLQPVILICQGNKLSQIAGGFIIGDAGEVRLKENPKLKELALLLDEINEKCIIFHEYTEEAHMIEELLTRRGLKFASLRAEIKDKTAEVVRFQTDPTCMVLVAHPQSGGAGLNLQMASVAIFYTSSYDGAVLRPQAEGRIWRDGQERSCLFIDILMSGSVDERKYAVRNTRADMAEVVLDYVRAKK